MLAAEFSAQIDSSSNPSLSTLKSAPRSRCVVSSRIVKSKRRIYWRGGRNRPSSKRGASRLPRTEVMVVIKSARQDEPKPLNLLPIRTTGRPRGEPVDPRLNSFLRSIEFERADRTVNRLPRGQCQCLRKKVRTQIPPVSSARSLVTIHVPIDS